MKRLSGGNFLDHLCRTVGAAALAGLSDAELLGRFRDCRGHEAEAAFAVLVQRHGPLVYRTCRLALRDGHDADDAFQATFFVLARKAKSLKLHGGLGPWLYEIARRVSAHARTVAARRMRHEHQAAVNEEHTPLENVPDHAAIVHDALGRLPERMRTPIVLCDLEGLSYQETAERLGWSLGAVRNRLARARQRLRVVLRRMGLDPAAASVAWHALPSVSREVSVSSAASGARIVSGLSTGAVSASVLSLTNQGVQSMLLIKLKTLGLTMTTTAVLMAGAYGLSGQTPAEKASPTVPGKPDASAAAAKPSVETAPKAGTAQILSKLNANVALESPLENVPLREALDFLSDRYGLSIIVDSQAFETEKGVRNVRDSQISLPKMTNISLNTLLRYLVVQVGGAVLVRNDHLEIVTDDRAFIESHGRFPMDPNVQRSPQPLVSFSASSTPLASILADIAKQAGRNVILDSRIPDREKLSVTATLLNVPIDTAVRVLAELTNLKCVRLDSVFFVTTRERAAEMQAEEESILEARKRDRQETKPAASAVPPAKP